MTNLIPGKNHPWEIVIGLEIHAQISTKSKLFSGASTEFGASPNSQVSFVDAAMPGMLPVLNEACLIAAIKTGLGLNAKINKFSAFDRKNYFYPDLPQGYQISQLYYPIVGEGSVIIDLEDGQTKAIGIERLHLEQDAGKSIHDQDPKRSFIDLNRSGVALMEIVTKPDFRSSAEVGDFLKKLRIIFRYLGTCDGNMDEGSMRCDINVSLRKPGDPFGTRTETKNVNSIRFAQMAIDFEVKRQQALLEAGEVIKQETRLFDGTSGTSRSLRSKETAEDYRYFPDPDLTPIILTQDYIDNIQSQMPELPDAKKQRFMVDLGLNAYEAEVLVAEKEKAEFFEKSLAGAQNPKTVATWVMGDFFAFLNKAGLDIAQSPIQPEYIGQLVGQIEKGVISGKMAKEIFEECWNSGQSPEILIQAKGLSQISDRGAIEAIVDEVLVKNPTQAEQFRSGDAKILGWLVGQVMKLSGGKANPALVNEILKTKN